MSSHFAKYIRALCFGLLTATSFQLASIDDAEAQSADPLEVNNQDRTVNNLRLWHSPDSTRVVFDVSADVGHKMFTLENPHRLVVDIQDATLNFRLPDIEQDNRFIAAIRSGRPDDKRLRFVFDLKEPIQGVDFVLSPNELYGHRLVIDLLSASDQTESALASRTRRENSTDIVAPPTQASGHNTRVENKRVEQQKELNEPWLVAIDAGHGGEDPGALGYRGSREKKITLAIANRLKSIIDRDPRMKSFMVRQGDYYIKLHKRRELARNEGADLFVSIHADAFRKKSASGFSVFALSQSGATSAMARALAAKENASDQIGGVSLADKDEVLAKVLVDLSMTNTISESVNFGGRVLKELAKIGKLHSRRVEQAGFAVLKSADIPSILVETGFITNPGEEKKLTSGAYQSRVAEAIYRATTEYYQQTPYKSNATYANPQQFDQNSAGYTSLVRPKKGASSKKSRSAKKVHKVVRGDSLSKIALKYGTTVSQLKQLNTLRGSKVMLGQSIKLPSSSNRQEVTRPSSYVVKRGDSLSKISKRFNVTIRSLKRQNSLTRDRVYVGQKLKIPGGSAGTENKSKGPLTHIVRRGDTLSEIAERYGSSINLIKQANSLKTARVLLGQKLKIPQ